MPTATGNRTPGAAPSRFAIVMAAGIISSGLGRSGHQLASLVFLGLGLASFAELTISEVWRLCRAPGRYLEAMLGARGALGLLTLGVGSAVLAARLSSTAAFGLALAFLALGVVVCVAGSVAVAGLLVARWRTSPALAAGGGLWLLWPVALEGASVGVSSVAAKAGVGIAWVSVLSLVLWAMGVALYLVVAPALVLRLWRRPPLAGVGPSYWIVMGAAALGALGARLISEDRGTHLVFGRGHPPFVELSLALFALATAMLPLPIAVTALRVSHRRLLIGAPKEYWAGVFPCGVYAVTSMAVAGGSVWWLAPVGEVAIWVAVGAFCADLTRMVWAVLLPGG